MKKILWFAFLFFSTPLSAQYVYWHQTSGPPAGNIADISIDSSGRIIIWSPGSGVFRSTDTAKSWYLFNQGLPTPQMYFGAASKDGYLFSTNAAASGNLFRYNENDPSARWELLESNWAINA